MSIFRKPFVGRNVVDAEFVDVGDADADGGEVFVPIPESKNCEPWAFDVEISSAM